MNTALGRSEIAILTNKSGGSVAQGDVVIVDTANAGAFTTTTTSGYVSGRLGVILEPNGIASNAAGLVAFCGYVPVINLSGTGNIGDLVKAHTVAKQGVRHAAPQVAGDFAQVLGTTATPAALLFGTVQLGGGSGENVATSAIWDAKGDLAAGTGADTAARLAVGSDGQHIIADSTQSTGLLWVTGARVLIATATPSGINTVTFSSIPGTYQALEILFTARSTKSANNEEITLEFNSDTTAANYRSTYAHTHSGDPATVGGQGRDVNSVAYISANSAPSNSAGAGRIIIPFYAGTTFNKVARSEGGYRYDSSSVQMINVTWATEWENAAAITQIVLKLASGNFVSGSNFRLYGLT